MASSDLEQAERIRALYGNVPVGVAVMLFAVASVAGGVIYLAPDRLPQLQVWIAAGLVIALAQIGVWLWRRRERSPDDAWPIWRNRLTVACLADGVRWGWATVWMAPPGAADLQVWVCMIVGGAACASVALWGNYVRVYYAFMLPAMVPYIVWAATVPDPRYRGVAVLGSILTLAMAWLSRRQSRAFADAIRLRFENLKLAERLAEQKAVAEQASLAKTQFLAAASHDLRQPMHALGMFVAALARTRMTPEGSRLTAQIASTVEAMGGLLGTLLDVSQLDAGLVKAEPRVFAIAPLLTRLCSEQAAELAHRPIQLQVVRSSAVVDTDPVLLERMLRNLISNAVRYTLAGRILVGCRRRGARLSVQVWDTGPGIEPDHQGQVFEAFFQAGNPERDRAKGLGLGLAITSRLSRLLNCPVTLASQIGRGSMFSISVPRARGEAAAIEMPAAESPARGLIFVIDDEQLVRDSMASLLLAWGYEVATAGSGDELMASIDRRRPPDLVICDWRLRAGGTATAAINQVRAAFGADTPALLISGDTAPSQLRAAHETGLVLLHKPVAPGRLRATIGNLLRASAGQATAFR